MSFADPQTITISAATTPLPRTSVGEDESEYTSGDGLYKLTASHSYGKRRRRVLRFDHAKMSPDVYKPTENVSVGMAVYTVFDMPGKGEYTPAEALAIWIGFNTQITATSNTLVTKLLGGES